MAKSLRITGKVALGIASFLAAAVICAEISSIVTNRICTLAIGRQHYAIEVDVDRYDVQIIFWHYITPLVKLRHDAELIRFHGYGWFVGEVRQAGWEGSTFRIAREEIDDEWEPVLMMVKYELRVRAWLFASITAAPLLIVIGARILRRRPHVGFPVGVDVGNREQPRRAKP